MKEDNDILKNIDHCDGMTVPEGYFAEFAQRMASSLPVTEFEESAGEVKPFVQRTLWQKVRPYVYMAAMFAGVWCMMKMFSSITANSDSLTPSATLAEALDNEIFFDDYIIDDVDTRDLMDQMIDDGVDFATLTNSLYDMPDDALLNTALPGDSPRTQEILNQ